MSAYEEGVKAFQDGRSYDSNPYDKDNKSYASFDRVEWASGWLDAEDLWLDR